MTGPDDPITLKDAASHFGFSEWTLRTEAGKGRVTTYRLGRKDYTTPNDIKEMGNKRRVEKKGQGFTLTRSASSGLSETDRASSAQAAASEAALRLRNISRNTSVKNTVQSRQVRR